MRDRETETETERTNDDDDDDAFLTYETYIHPLEIEFEKHTRYSTFCQQ